MRIKRRKGKERGNTRIGITVQEQRMGKEKDKRQKKLSEKIEDKLIIRMLKNEWGGYYSVEGRYDEWLIKEALPHRASFRVRHENVLFAACIVANLDALF